MDKNGFLKLIEQGAVDDVVDALKCDNALWGL
jgi:hypothetical protein